MTEYLVGHTKIFHREPVVIADVGARWGHNEEWKVFKDCLRVYCFEPDADECRKLNAGAPSGVTYLPIALGKDSGKATLFETKLNASTGLYPTNMEFFSRLLNGDNGKIVAQHEINVMTLDEAVGRFNIPSLDFLKLDVEGAELDVLQGGGACVRSPSLLGILTEFRFHEEINGCPVFWQLDAYVRRLGFRLFDMQYSHQSRRVLPYPGLQDYRLPNGERFFAYTRHGQVMDGDALYFRDLLIRVNAPIVALASAAQLLKAAALFEIYSLSDCAAELILANRERLAPHVDCERLLDLLTPPINGRKLSYRAYVEAYFDPKKDTGDPPTNKRTGGLLKRAWRAAARRISILRRI
jgi:FkbM family methyltransferase